MAEHDVGRLEAQIKEVHDILKDLVRERDVEEFVRLIRRPGWTTPAEFLFAMGLAESMVATAKGLAGVQQALFAGGRAVVAKG